KLLVLGQHERRVLVGGGEVVVPEQRQLLDQRALRAHHPVQPPQHVVAVLVRRVERLAVDGRRGTAQLRAGPAVEDPLQRGRLTPIVARAPAAISPLAARRRPRRSSTTRSCTSSPRLDTLRRSVPGHTTGRYTLMRNSRSPMPTAVAAGRAGAAAGAPAAPISAAAIAASRPAGGAPRARVMLMGSARA